LRSRCLLPPSYLQASTPTRSRAPVLRSQFKDHRFQPSQLSAPPDRPISIRVKNLDAAPMEFESVSLRVEKVIGPGGEGVVNVKALAPGRYEFFDDFHSETRGILVVE
jgi:hypothetical protein